MGNWSNGTWVEYWYVACQERLESDGLNDTRRHGGATARRNTPVNATVSLLAICMIVFVTQCLVNSIMRLTCRTAHRNKRELIDGGWNLRCVRCYLFTDFQQNWCLNLKKHVAQERSVNETFAQYNTDYHVGLYVRDHPVRSRGVDSIGLRGVGAPSEVTKGGPVDLLPVGDGRYAMVPAHWIQV